MTPEVKNSDVSSGLAEIWSRYSASASRNDGTASVVSCLPTEINQLAAIRSLKHDLPFGVKVSSGSIPVSLVSSPQNIYLPPYLEVPADAISLELLDAYLSGELQPHQLLLQIARQYIPRELRTYSPVSQDFGRRSWHEYLHRTGYSGDVITPPAFRTHKSTLSQEGILWCYGKSCSGKTFFAIHAVANENNQFVYNPVFAHSIPLEFALLIILFGTGFRLILDDLQCLSETGQFLLSSCQAHKVSLPSRNIKIVAVSWDDFFFSVRSRIYLDIKWFNLDSQNFVDLLKHRLGARCSEVQSFAKENIALWHAASRLVTEGEPGKSLQDAVTRRFVQGSDSIVFVQGYIAAVLGRYEFEAPISFIETLSGESIRLDERTCPSSKVIGGRFFFGHRTIAAFVADEIVRYFVPSLDERSIVLAYLYSLDARDLWRSVSQMLGQNRASLSAQFIPIWQLLSSFEEAIVGQNQMDPSWNATPSSMYFAGRALGMIGRDDELRKTVGALTSRVTYSRNALELCLQDFQTSNDFRLIKERMSLEDGDIDYGASYEKGEGIADEQMHLNFLLGLISGLGRELQIASHADLHALVVNALLDRQLPSGAWYPQRVPWITARIVIGLGSSGFNTSDERIAKAAAYLGEEIAFDGRCNPRTGGWNNEVETTALVLEAMASVGVDLGSDDRTRAGLEFLRGSSGAWMTADRELEGATAACLLIRYGYAGGSLITFIKNLADRNLESIVGRPLNLECEQSCKPAQIAFYVLNLGWELLQSDLPSLLEGFVGNDVGTSLEKLESSTVLSESVDPLDLFHSELAGLMVELRAAEGEHGLFDPSEIEARKRRLWHRIVLHFERFGAYRARIENYDADLELAKRSARNFGEN